MLSERVLFALNNVDDAFLEEAETLLVQQAKARKFAKKTILRTFLIAAILATLLAATAYAVFSIHQKRQQELREKLKIEEHEVSDYVEFDIPDAESASRVTLLSTMNDGTFQQVWAVISGVTPEMIEALSFPILTDRDGAPLSEDDHRYQCIYCSWDDESWFDTTAHGLQSPGDAYDAESQTLLVNTALTLWDMPDHVSLRFALWDIIDYASHWSDGEEVLDFGTVEVSRTSQTVRIVWFSEPVPFENGTYGKGEFLGAELSASGVNWLLRHDGAAEMYQTHDFANEEERLAYLERERSWVNAIEELERDAVFSFTDGSSRLAGPPLSSEKEGDLVRDICFWEDGTADISRAVSVSIGGKTFPLESQPS